MSRHRKRRRYDTPTLVPLADMLTNTVGITIFIMIFTVLTAGGAVIAKRLPIEHSTEAGFITFLCAGNRVLALNEDRLLAEFTKPMARLSSFDAVPGWVERFNARTISTGEFVVSGDARANYSNDFFRRSVTVSQTVVFTPIPGRGESPEALRSEASAFRRFLAGRNARTHFVFFSVRPDSVAVFEAARAIAFELGFEAGWSPNSSSDGAVRFSLSGSGTAPKPL
jgi:hypothetical protein